jgi:hypothetical protein
MPPLASWGSEADELDLYIKEENLPLLRGEQPVRPRARMTMDRKTADNRIVDYRPIRKDA